MFPGRSNINVNYSVGTATTIAEVERLRPIWQQFKPHLNADIDFYLTTVESRPSILRPHIVYIESGETIVAMAVGRIEESVCDLKIGYKLVCKPKMKSLTVIYGGLLGDLSCHVYELLLAELLNVVRRREVDVLTFHALPKECSLIEMAVKHCRLTQNSPNVHWSMRSPKNMDEFFKKLGRKHRQWIRHLPRVLEKDCPGRVTQRCFSSEEDVSWLYNDVEKVAARTYQRGLGVGFINSHEDRSRLALAVSKGWLRAYVLYVDGNPCAFWIGTLYKKTFYLDFTGYDPLYQKYSPGIILFVKMLEAVITEGVQTIDFGFGDAVYKRRFGDNQWQEISTVIYASTIRGKALHIMNFCASKLSLLGRVTMEKSELSDKVKKLWRNRLTEAGLGGGTRPPANTDL